MKKSNSTFKDERPSLAGRTVTIGEKRFAIKPQEIGRGASCICYDVTELGDGYRNERILKQFFPHTALTKKYSLPVRLNGTDLELRGMEQAPELVALDNCFDRAYRIQEKLSNCPETMGCVVKTAWKYVDGTTKYALLDANWGTSVEKKAFRDIEDYLDFFLQLADAAARIHRQGILYIDYKLENILLADQGKNLKLFDFDAAIDTTATKDIILRATDPEWIAPELRLTEDLDAAGQLYLSPQTGAKTDIFSLGCLMFRCLFGVSPTEEDEKNDAIRERIRSKFENEWRAQLSAQQQALLCQILKRAIAYYRTDRYGSCDELIADLKELRSSMREPTKQYKVSDESRLFNAAQVINSYPLFNYMHTDENGRQVMDVAIIGDSPMRDTLVKHVFACAQLPDTDLNIRIVSEDAGAYLQKLRKDCPLLDTTVRMYLNGVAKHKTLNKEITETPLANLYFYETEHFSEEEKAADSQFTLELYDVTPLPRYYLLVSEDEKKNSAAAEHLIRHYTKAKGETVFIGYLNDRGDGYGLQNFSRKGSLKRIQSASFGENAKYSADEKKFKTEIEKRALAVHAFYTKGYWETASKEEIRKSLEGYNLRSSLRAALSIPYKLFACGGLRETDEAAGLKFYRAVFGTDAGKKTAEAEKNRMIWLEHRSWQAFMIMEGWRKPSWEELEDYAFRRGNDHRNKEETKKLSPCICASGIDKPLACQTLTKSEWNSLTEEEMTAKGFDPLDKMSVHLHQLCGRLARENGDLLSYFKSLREELHGANADEKLLGDTDYLQELCKRMRRGDPNINRRWSDFCGEYMTLLKEDRYEHARAVFSQIRDKMKVTAAYNSFRDYKGIDIDILHAIPLILMNKPIKTVYKLLCPQTWANLMSVILLEPDELVLLSAEPAEPDTAPWKMFLRQRGLGHVKIRTALLDGVRPSARTGAVLDITAAPPELVCRAAADSRFKTLPVVLYENGGLVSLTGFDELAFCAQTRSLTVGETLQMLGATAPKSREQDLLLDLWSTYQEIWNVYQDSIRTPDIKGKTDFSNFPWKILCDFIADQERSRYIPLNVGILRQKADHYTTADMSLRNINAYGLDKVLDGLRQYGLIEDPVQLPDEDADGPISFNAKWSGAAATLNMLYEQAKDDTTVQYRLEKLWNEPLDGKPLKQPGYYVVNNSRSVNASVPHRIETAFGEKNRQYQNVDVLRQILTRMASCRKLLSEKPTFETLESGETLIRFRFASRAVKECLIKEGNALEAYTFHTIRDSVSLFDDYRMNVSFAWDTLASDDEFYAYGTVTNEVDCVCTQKTQSIFISCKQAKLKNDHLNEIRYLADRFGVNARAIIVCSHYSPLNSNDAIVRRAKSMGISIIPAGKLTDRRTFAEALRAAVKKRNFGGLIE